MLILLQKRLKFMNNVDFSKKIGYTEDGRNMLEGREKLMKITSVNVRRVEKENSRMKGIATVILDDCFAVHGIRIIERTEGLFVAMPSRKTSDNTYHDIAHPITSECRKMFEDAVIAKYNETEAE